MISQVLCEDSPGNDPAPYIPTFYQFSELIEHSPATDVSVKCTNIIATIELLLLHSGTTDATTLNSFVLPYCTGKCVALRLWSFWTDHNITKDFKGIILYYWVCPLVRVGVCWCSLCMFFIVMKQRLSLLMIVHPYDIGF